MSRFLNYFTASFFLYALLLLLGAYVSTRTIPEKKFVLLDMRAFYSAGVMMREGVTTDFYDIDTQALWQKKIFRHTVSEAVLPFFNPPFVAIFFVPFTVVSYNVAYQTFAFISAGITLVSVYILLREHNKTYLKKWALLFFIFVFFFFPILYTFFLGQLSCFLLLSVVLSWYFFKHEKPVRAGVWLALLLIKPQLLIFPLLLLLWKRQWKALGGLFFSTGVLIIISLYAIGLAGMEKYVLLLSTPFQGYNRMDYSPWDPTLRGFLQLVLQTHLLSVIIIPLIAGSLVAGLFFFFLWKGPWDTRTERFDLQWALLIIIVIITSLHTDYYDLTLLLFPCVVLFSKIHTYVLLYFAILVTDMILLLCGPRPSLLFPFILILLGLLYQKLYKAKGIALAT